MTKLKNIVAKAMSKIEKKASTVGDINIGEIELPENRVYVDSTGIENFVKETYGQQYPNIVDVYVTDKKCVVDWAVGFDNYGLGVSFKPMIEAVYLSANVEIITEGDKSNYEYIDIPSEQYSIEIEYTGRESAGIEQPILEIENVDIEISDKKVIVRCIS